MSTPEHRIFERLFEHASYYEAKGVIHIGYSTGKPGRWIAHVLCRRKLRNWIGFSDIRYGKTDIVCDECAMLFIAQHLTEKAILNAKGVKPEMPDANISKAQVPSSGLGGSLDTSSLNKKEIGEKTL